MKKLSMILTVLVIFGSSAIGHTSDECVVFEGTFEMSTRRPVAQLEYFQALDGEAILKVFDESKGHHAKKITSANISINGKKVIHSWDFCKRKFVRFWHSGKKKFFHYSRVKQPDDVIEKTVKLDNGRNSLEVKLSSMRGGKIRVVIVGQKFIESDDDGDEILMSYETPCTGGNTNLCNDNCPNDFNPDQADSDGDGIGDVCDDTDGYPSNFIATVDVGDMPYGKMAVSLNGEYVYVSNYNSNTVSVISTSSKAVIKEIDVGKNPGDISMSPGGDYVYVSNKFDDSVSVIQTSDNTEIDLDPSTVEIDRIAVGDGPFGVFVSPVGDYVYVNNFNEDTVSVIQTSDNTEIATIDVGDGPYGISVTPNGAYVYVTNFNEDTVSVIRISDNAEIDLDPSTVEIDRIPVGDGPIGVSITPNGEFAYVSNYYISSVYLHSTVSVIRTSDNTVIKTIPVGNLSHGISVSPNGAYVYVNNFNDDTVSVIQTSDNTVIDTDPSTVDIDPIPVGDGPHGGIAVSSDGKFVYVGNFNADTVTIIGF